MRLKLRTFDAMVELRDERKVSDSDPRVQRKPFKYLRTAQDFQVNSNLLSYPLVLST